MLEVNGLSSGYGRVPVVHDISFTARAGEILAILGANGAGKTTLLHTISGFLKPSSGSVVVSGKDITGMSPEQSTRLGLRLVLDGHRVFPNMSVRDNIRLGAQVSRSPETTQSQIEKIFDVFPVLKEKFGNHARDLSGGQQQMLALAKAFVAQPDILLCDEPSLGLALALMPPIFQFLRRWADEGATIVIVEQQVDMVLRMADYALVMDRGAIRLTGKASDLCNDDRVRQIYLGQDEPASVR